MTEATLRDGVIDGGAAVVGGDTLERTALEESRGGTFRSLRHKDYRLLWISTLFTSAGQWFHQITVGWLVFELTKSAFLLGAVNGFRALPLLLLAPVGGVAADRVDRKLLLQSTQVLAFVASAAMAAILFAGVLELWHLFAFTLITGVVWAFNNPVRQSIVPNLVPKRDLMNALALNSAGFNITRILGPALAGVILANLGGAENFSLQTLAYACVFLMVMRMTVPPMERANTVSISENLTEGMKYVWTHKTLRSQLTLAFVPTILAFPYMALMPIFASEVLGRGESGYGIMGSAVGVGAVLGTLTLATLSNVERRGMLMLSAILLLGASLVAFSLSRSFQLSLFFLAITGAAQMVYLTTNQTILQLIVPDQLRGRVMGIYMLSQGMMPLGGLLGGALADATSAPTAVMILGLLVCVMAMLFMLRAKDLRSV
ncbi:MAG TPA: MFS transporter [Dehalococcoidia bacterium]|nr:MFS transporter [Dehalococcoidia bacterium]